MSFPAWIEPTWIQAFGWTLFHSLWQGSLVAVGLAVILAILRDRSPRINYLLGIVALTTLSFWSGWTFVSELDLARSEAQPSFEVTAATTLLIEDTVLPETINADWLSEAQLRLEGILPWLVLIWATGFLFFSLRWLGAFLWLRRLRHRFTMPLEDKWQQRVNELADRMGLKKQIPILAARKIDVPMVVGHLRPVIILPVAMLSGLSPQQAEAILVHELAHIRRYDYVVNMIVAFLGAIFFYHPAYWWITEKVETAREHCCDDVAVSFCGDPVTYARTLADLEARRIRHRQLAVALSGRKGSLLERIRRLVSAPNHNPNLQTRGLAAFMLGIFLLATFIYLPTSLKSTELPSFEPLVLMENELPWVPASDHAAEALEVQVLLNEEIEIPNPQRRCNQEVKDIDPVLRLRGISPHTVSVASDTPPPPPPPPPPRIAPPAPPVPPAPPAPPRTSAFKDIDWEKVEAGDPEEMAKVEKVVEEFEAAWEEWGEEFAGRWEQQSEEWEAWGKQWEKEMAPQWEAFAQEMTVWAENLATGEEIEEQVAAQLRAAEIQAEMAQEMAERQKEQALRQQERAERVLERALRQAERARERAERQKSNTDRMFDELRNELLEDGLIEDRNDDLRIQMKKGVLRINGKKIEGADRERYERIFQRHGMTIGDNTTMDISID